MAVGEMGNVYRPIFIWCLVYAWVVCEVPWVRKHTRTPGLTGRRRRLMVEREAAVPSRLPCSRLFIVRCQTSMDYLPYPNPTYPVGSIVNIADPTTHNDLDKTTSVMGLVYEAYIHKGFPMYGVLMGKNHACYDMKEFKQSTSCLSSDICCQHLDENRITPLDTKMHMR